MTCRRLIILVPVAVLLFVNCAVQVTAEQGTNGSSTQTNVTKAEKVAVTKTQHNVTLTSTNIPFTQPVHFGPMVKRLAIVALILSVIVAIYFVWKMCGTRKRKARKYGVVKTPGDVEMRPLESDDEDDDEDVTMFDRKH